MNVDEFWFLQCLTYRERTFYGVCVNAMFTLNHLLSYTVLVLWRSSTRRCTERKMRAMRGRSCGVNMLRFELPTCSTHVNSRPRGVKHNLVQVKL